uniref:Uncharacterized protein n=1 Tax=Rhodococcus aetherivorans I24 TaxID=1036179 RepID=Q157E8_9NOCA|nr:hypothetical protein [Rhodococcus aetherivorans]ABG29065.1 hypothetical protein [Rhodococcus aetherivorans I24]
MYGPSAYPAWGVSLNLAQRSSTRDGITLHDPAEVVMCAEHPVTRLSEGDLRALARDALALADQLANLTYAPMENLR